MTITPEQLTTHQLAHLANFQAFGLLDAGAAMTARVHIRAIVADLQANHADWMRDAPSIEALLWRYGEEPDCLPPFANGTAGHWAMSAALTEARARLGREDITARENFAGSWVVFWPGNTMGAQFHTYKDACRALAALREVSNA